MAQGEIQKSSNHGIPQDAANKLMDSWDAMSQAIGHMLTSQPSRMTEAAENLEAKREQMHQAIKVIRRSGPFL